MIEGIHKLFSKKSRARQYGYESEYGDVDDGESEDIFPDDDYMNHYDCDDEYFD